MGPPPCRGRLPAGLPGLPQQLLGLGHASAQIAADDHPIEPADREQACAVARLRHPNAVNRVLVGRSGIDHGCENGLSVEGEGGVTGSIAAFQTELLEKIGF